MKRGYVPPHLRDGAKGVTHTQRIWQVELQYCPDYPFLREGCPEELHDFSAEDKTSADKSPSSYIDQTGNTHGLKMLVFDFPAHASVTDIEDLLFWFKNASMQNARALLKFPSCLDKHQRAQIHKEAERIGLDSESKGWGGDRYLTLGPQQSPVSEMMSSSGLGMTSGHHRQRSQERSHWRGEEQGTEHHHNKKSSHWTGDEQCTEHHKTYEEMNGERRGMGRKDGPWKKHDQRGDDENDDGDGERGQGLIAIDKGSRKVDTKVRVHPRVARTLDNHTLSHSSLEHRASQLWTWCSQEGGSFDQYSKGELLEMIASEQKLPEELQELESKWASGNKLIEFIKQGREDEALYQLQSCPSAAWCRDSNGERGYPVHLAAERGMLSLVQVLIRMPGVMTSRDSKYRSPLDVAKKAGQQNTVEILMNGISPI